MTNETNWLKATVAGGFCESILYLDNRTGPWPNEPPFVGRRPGRPEVASMVTAVFIVFLGAYQLLFFRHPDNGVRYLGALILLNGISSYLNHEKHHVFWSYLDGSSMIIAVNLATAIVAHTYISLGVHYARVSPLPSCWRACVPCRDLVIGILWIVCCIVVTCAGLTSVSPLSGMFDAGGIVLLFNFPILLMVVTMVYLISPWGVHLVQTTDANDLKLARTYAPVGILSYLTGFVFWNVVERGCENMPDSLIAVAHAVWHLTAAYGLHVLVSILVYLRAPLAHAHTFHWTTARGTAARVWFLLFPLPVVELAYVPVPRKGTTRLQEGLEV